MFRLRYNQIVSRSTISTVAIVPILPSNQVKSIGINFHSFFLFLHEVEKPTEPTRL